MDWLRWFLELKSNTLEVKEVLLITQPPLHLGMFLIEIYSLQIEHADLIFFDMTCDSKIDGLCLQAHFHG